MRALCGRTRRRGALVAGIAAWARRSATRRDMSFGVAERRRHALFSPSPTGRGGRGVRPPSRRGAIFILAALALVGVLAALSSTFLLTVALRGRQAAYERHAVQAMYAAEAGVEAALALLAEGHRPAEAVTGDCGDARFTCTVREEGHDLRLTSTGVVAPPVGRAVYRRLVVTARREGPGVRVLQYTPKRCQEPFPPEKVPDTFSRDTEG